MRILTYLTFNKHLLASINHNRVIQLNKSWLKISRFVSAPSQKQPDPENVIFTVPNALTLSRIVSVPFINYFVFTGQHELACSLFVLAGVTDFVDGFVARNFRNQKSYLGSIIDPLADKLLIGSLTVTLMLNSMMPVPLACLILARDLSLIMYSIHVRFKLIQKPVTLRKFLNLKQSRVKVEADMISKVNTFFQISLIAATLPSQVFLYEDSYYLVVLQLATGLTTLMSSISYAYKKGSYKAIDKAKNK